MTDDTHLTTRRGLLSSIVIAIGTSSAGCLTTAGDRTESGSSTTVPTGSRSSTSSDASGGGSSTESPPHTTTERDHSPKTRSPTDRRQSTETPTTTTEREHATNTPSPETTTTDQSSGSIDYVSRFKGRLTDRFVPVKSISVTDDRVQLTYVARSEYAHEIASGIETIVVSFIRVYMNGWSVDGLDATVMDPHHSDEVMGYWRLETDWIARTLEGGDWSQTDLFERVLETYHGTLKHGHHDAHA